MESFSELAATQPWAVIGSILAIVRLEVSDPHTLPDSNQLCSSSFRPTSSFSSAAGWQHSQRPGRNCTWLLYPYAHGNSSLKIFLRFARPQQEREEREPKMGRNRKVTYIYFINHCSAGARLLHYFCSFAIDYTTVSPVFTLQKVRTMNRTTNSLFQRKRKLYKSGWERAEIMR